MLILYRGNGQLGNALKDHLNLVEREVIIHHRWDYRDKSEEKQKEIYKDFKEFVGIHNKKEICFISTANRDLNSYTYYKKEAEKYLIENCQKGYVVRLPLILGRGICSDFRDNLKKPFGKIELITMDESIEWILNIINNKERDKINEIHGEKISAKMIYNLIQFGKNGPK